MFKNIFIGLVAFFILFPCSAFAGSAVAHQDPEEGDLFLVTGEVQGVEIPFVVDTGASSVLLSHDNAAKIHLPAPDRCDGAATAGGVVNVCWYTLPEMSVGDITLRE